MKYKVIFMVCTSIFYLLSHSFRPQNSSIMSSGYIADIAKKGFGEGTNELYDKYGYFSL